MPIFSQESRAPSVAIFHASEGSHPSAICKKCTTPSLSQASEAPSLIASKAPSQGSQTRIDLRTAILERSMDSSVRSSTSKSPHRQAYVPGAPNSPVISRIGHPGEREMAITPAPGSAKQVLRSVTSSLLGGSSGSVSSPRKTSDSVVPNSLAALRSGYSEQARTNKTLAPSQVGSVKQTPLSEEFIFPGSSLGLGIDCTPSRHFVEKHDQPSTGAARAVRRQLPIHCARSTQELVGIRNVRTVVHEVHGISETIYKRTYSPTSCLNWTA